MKDWKKLALDTPGETAESRQFKSLMLAELAAEKAKLAALQGHIDRETMGVAPQILDNVERAFGLVLAAATFEDPGARDDVLRAAVVFGHALLEDSLRTLAANLLPRQNESTLNDVPLAGLNNNGRPEKFLLGKLVSYKGKLVDDVIRESAWEYLERSTFNNTGDIGRLLETLGFHVSDHNKVFPMLDQMMQRRHLIVHRADKIKRLDSNSYELQPIDGREVLKWIGSTGHFLSSLVPPLIKMLSTIADASPKSNA